MAAAKNGWIDEERHPWKASFSFKRAGCAA